MVDVNSYWYHLRTHKKRYIILGLQFIMLMIGSIFIAIGDYESRSTMFALGVLSLMGSIAWFGVYIIWNLFYPDIECCCGGHEWEQYQAI